MKSIHLLLLLLPFMLACRSGKPTSGQLSTSMNEPSFAPGPAAIVYKTTKNYDNNVPVMMNEARTAIVSYPDPRDVYRNGKPTCPTPLANGYLLDNRGIGANVAFLSYTYEEYHQLAKAPSLSELMEHIIDKYPLAEAWNCGLRSQYKEEVKELNRHIENQFKGCKSIQAQSVTLPSIKR